MNPAVTRHWLLIVEGDVEPFLIGPVDEPDVLKNAREHRANDPSAADGLYALTLDAEGDLHIDAFAYAEREPEETPASP
jgi:hypothetical protein